MKINPTNKTREELIAEEVISMYPVYTGPTPEQEADAERERFARLERETIASWSKVEQERQAIIDWQLINMPIISAYENTLLIESAKEHVKSLRNGSRKYGQPNNEIRLSNNWIASYVERNMKL